MPTYLVASPRSGKGEKKAPGDTPTGLLALHLAVPAALAVRRRAEAGGVMAWERGEGKGREGVDVDFYALTLGCHHGMASLGTGALLKLPE